MPKILFICLGNICRSPMAESVLQNMLENSPDVDLSKWEVKSAAIGDWHSGRGADPRCIQVLREHNIISKHVARQICKKDFKQFDLIIGMDDMNIKDLKDMAPVDCMTKIELLGEYNKNGPSEIPDPYYSSGVGEFRKCYELITAACERFLQSYGERHPSLLNH